MLENEIINLRYILLDSSELVAVSSLGKPLGLNGGIRAFLITDFPEIFIKDSTFYICFDELRNNKSSDNIVKLVNSLVHNANTNTNNKINPSERLSKTSCIMLTLCKYDTKRQALFFHEITSKEKAEAFRNATLYSTIERTRQFCKLSEFEFFYFDIIGMQVVEEGEIIGIVTDIQYIANTHYFILDKDFLIPYSDRYILSIDKDKGQIITRDARFLRA